jgi:hypothetical protein
MNNNALLHKQGSCLLTVMIIVTLISLFCLTIWRTTVVAFDLALKKQEYEQQFQSTHGIMLWALDVGKNNFDILYNNITSNKEGLCVEFPLPNNNHSSYRGDLFFKQKKSMLSLTVHLYGKNALVCSLSCCLTKLDSNSYKISEWTLHGG